MRFFTLALLCFLSLHLSARAAGGSEYIYFVRPPWTLEINGENGSSAYLTYKKGAHELRAQLRFKQFDTYSQALLSLRPIRAKIGLHREERCWYLSTDPENPLKLYFDFSAVESLMALIVFEHLGDIYADDPSAFQEVFLRTPPLPAVRDWQPQARWSTIFHVHDRTKSGP